jgi:transcriptional regulator with XRE-family HTH domain
MDIGDRMRQRRKHIGMSVAQLARHTELTESAIRAIESGQTKHVRLPNGLEIADSLGVSPWWLLGEDDPLDAKIQHSLEYTRIRN